MILNALSYHHNHDIFSSCIIPLFTATKSRKLIQTVSFADNYHSIKTMLFTTKKDYNKEALTIFIFRH